MVFIFNIDLLRKNFPNKMAVCYVCLVAAITLLSLTNLHLSRVLKQHWLNALPYQQMMVVLYPDYLRFDRDQLVVDLRFRAGEHG